jgi:hypothetical protein
VRVRTAGEHVLDDDAQQFREQRRHCGNQHTDHLSGTLARGRHLHSARTWRVRAKGLLGAHETVSTPALFTVALQIKRTIKRTTASQ